MSIDSSEKESYREISRGKVATSNQLDDNVIADYDAMGNVVGLEFLDPAAAADWEKFLALANQKTPGASKVPKPPAGGVAS
ncbi:hypothetical protein CR105_12840 [Massilia eurypsychrophila]|uniref:DUF2283 domain-containing protein n=1 Tax=Massilia eurypsychrophila TaxID=1485217 RepID=A0A2G8TFF8_9BURK|nr:DUF2283 domain-containing protein [Massilia eurypsychrophila]PIL44785.1 hypothetical protein CR105_12840 [Massilia eurypsychrophila]